MLPTPSRVFNVVGITLPVSRAPRTATPRTPGEREPGVAIQALARRRSLARELLLEGGMAFKVAIGTFGDDDTAEIKVDGRAVGWLERVRGERFKSASSRARVSFISHYAIVLMDDAADDQLREHDVTSRAAAKIEVERAFQRAWDKLAGDDLNHRAPGRDADGEPGNVSE